MVNIEYIRLVLIPIVIGLVEIVKTIDKLDSRYYPVVSLFFGVVASIVFSGTNLIDSILVGLIIGLSASGLFDFGTDTFIKK